MQRTRVIGWAAAVLIAAGAVVALHDGRDTAHTDAASNASEARVASAPADQRQSLDAAAGSVAPQASKAAIAPNGPWVVKTATIALSVAKNGSVAKVSDRVAQLAAAHSGYVASTQSQRGDHASSTITVRVPAAAFDAALTELRTLGKVTSESLGGDDVTGQLVDLDARLRSLRAQEQALNALLAKANTVGETLQVAQASAEVRTQIEQLAAQQSQLSDQADFATISVQVLGPFASPNPEPKPEPLLVKSFQRAGAGTLNVLGGVIVVLGYALPTGLLAGLGYGVWRLINRRRQGQVASEPAVA